MQDKEEKPLSTKERGVAVAEWICVRGTRIVDFGELFSKLPATRSDIENGSVALAGDQRQRELR